jgi:Transglycosylase SLT domain
MAVIGRFLESAIWCGYQGGMRPEGYPFFALALAGCALIAFVPASFAGPHDALIAKHAAANGVPEQLVRRVIQIESRGNASLASRGNYGLMQIRLGTARGVGYSGEAQGLLNADTNLTYAVRYLAGAYRAAGCNADRAVRYYQRGYYGAAQRECGGSSPAVAQLAQVAATKPADVIKPKVVRTETIEPKSGSAAARPIGNFEPARVAPPPVQPVAAVTAAPPRLASTPKPEPTPKPELPPKPESTPKTDMLKPAAAEPAAKFELASVPLPPLRPELDAAPKQELQPVQRPARANEKADKKSKAKTKSKIAAKPKPESKPKAEPASTIPDPAGVVSFLKKLVTPDKNTRRQATEADADPPSHVQPPQ